VDCDKEEQEDEKLSGTFSDAGPVPEAPAKGTVKWNKVVFGFELTGRLAQTVTFKGTIESATKMAGALGHPFCGEGCEWTATKKQSCRSAAILQAPSPLTAAKKSFTHP
jgi:hypothetical protein